MTTHEGTASDVPVPTVWSGIPHRDKYFTGREQLLDELRRCLTRAATAILPHTLHGLGGVGKTQLAIEYAHRYANDYQAVWWIPAEQAGLIRPALAGLAASLGLTGIAPGQAEATASAVLDALRRGEPYNRWLLIFDNADEPEPIRALMPSGPGHVLVTSRNRRWEQVADVIDVDVFSRAESSQFLTRRNPAITSHDAARLAEQLGDLPLALGQAAALLAETFMTAEVYLDLLQDKASRLLTENASASGYPVPVAAAWSLSVNRLREQTPYAMELLQRCAFLGGTPIPLDLLERGSGVLSGSLPETLRDPILLGRAVRALSRYGLARIDNGQRSLQVHRLVQRLLRDELSTESRTAMRHEVHLLIAAATPGDPDDIENWSKYASLIPHIGPSEAHMCRSGQVRQLVQDIVRYLYVTGAYFSALASTEQALAQWVTDSGEDNSRVLIMNRLKAQSLRSLARYKESDELAGATLNRMSRLFGDDHEETLILMNGRCVDMWARGDFMASVEFTKTTLERHRAVLGSEHPRTFAAMTNFAASLEVSGDYVAAQILNERTYRGKREFYRRDDHPIVLLTLSSLARTIRKRGYYAEALKMTELAYRGYQSLVQKRVLSTNHPWVLRPSVDLSVVRRDVGSFAESMELAQDAYGRYCQVFSEDHPGTLMAANSLGNTMRVLGEFHKAEVLLEDTLRRFNTTLGSGHPDTYCAAQSLAIVKRRLGDAESATRLLTGAKEGLARRLGPEHHYTLVCTANLASALAALGEIRVAAQLGEETLPRFQATLGADHPDTLACLANLALDLKALRQIRRATELASEVGVRIRRALGSDHPEVTALMDGHRLDISIDLTTMF